MIPSPDTDYLVNTESYRREARVAACGGHDPISVRLMYTLDPSLTYDDGERINNIGGVIYRPAAKLWLHRAMADLVVDAAIHLHRTHGWSLQLMDGLRTVDAQAAMRTVASPRWYSANMLSLPGDGAHPKGMAIDLTALDKTGAELDMGTHVDALKPVEVRRDWPGLSNTQRKNRLAVECAMQRAALARGHLLNPLRNEFWDYRFPQNPGDWWRTLESVARCAGIPFPEELLNREFADYAEFKSCWRTLFGAAETQALLESSLGTAQPPESETSLMHHGDFPALCEADLKAAGKGMAPDIPHKPVNTPAHL